MLSKLTKNPIYYWILFFWFTQLINFSDGGVNANSRFAALRAMTLESSFKIDHNYDWTIDWSRTPDGHYYSNKAPGPMFVAYPLAFILDQIGVKTGFISKTVVNSVPVYERPGIHYKLLLSWLLQALPFGILTFFLLEYLAEMGLSFEARNFAALAILFGNTAVFFMNNYFGHGMAATFVLGIILAYLRKNYFWVGFCYGFATLCDYGAALLVIPLMILLISERRFSVWWECALGGLLPGALWIGYHTVCFGSPFSLPMKFQNPIFVEKTEPEKKIWGVIAPFPHFEILIELLFKPRRGLLFTQPWIYPVFFISATLGILKKPLFNKKGFNGILLLSLLGLSALLWMNSGFNGWHGGGTPGPRYIALILPAIGLLGAYAYDLSSKVLRKFLWLTLSISVLFRIIVYCQDMLCPEYAQLWQWFGSNLKLSPATPSGRTFFLFILLMIALVRKIFKERPQAPETLSLNSKH